MDAVTLAMANAYTKKRSPEFYPRDYGAKFDGSTDDYDALQNCINAAAAYATTSGRAVVLLPAGTAVLGKAAAGGLRLPAASPGLTIRGMGEGITVIKLTKECLRAFDFWRHDLTFTNITLERFTVDADNVGITQVGAAQTIAGGYTLASNANTTVTVPSTTGWATAGRCFFPATNTGTSAGKAMQYTVASPTTLSVANFTGGSLTIVASDVIQGAVDDHVIAGTRFSGGDAGFASTNLIFSDIVIQDITAVNIPTVIGATVAAPATGHTRWGVCISPAYNFGSPPGSPLRLDRIKVKNVRITGGEQGVFIGFFGNMGGTSGFFDGIDIVDCKHTTNLLPTANYFSANFEIGGSGYGNRCSVKNCTGWGSGDVGVEINAAMDALVSDCTMEEYQGGAYFHSNYNTAAPTVAGPQTMTLSADSVIADTTLTISTVNASIPTTGFAIMGTECIWYAITADTTLSVIRAQNGSTAANLPSGTVLTVQPSNAQLLTFRNCKAKLTQVVPPAGAWIPKGWYTIHGSSSTYRPTAQIKIRDCSAEYTIPFMGSKFSGGEVIAFDGQTMLTSIDGLTIERNGILYTTLDARIGALMTFACATGPNGQVAALTLKNIEARMQGTLASGASNPRYRGIIIDTGNWRLDADGIALHQVFRASAAQSNVGLELTAIAGTTHLRGSIRRYRYQSSSRTGDAAPVALIAASTGGGTIIDFLDINGVDVNGMSYSANGTNSNYASLSIDVTNQPFVTVEGWRHPQAQVTMYPTHPLRRTTTTTSYTVLRNDQYVGVSAAGAVTITLPAVTAASATAKPNPGVGKTLIIKDENGTAGSNTITVAANGSETIDGAASKTITVAYGALKLLSIGTAWVTT